ncbi:MAG: hypothetical protein O2960_22175 [Verrucomicrobia bacterium]|nr:hypothetical protein [Verrucomicrobiota bacterium]
MKRTALITLCIGIATAILFYRWALSSSPIPGPVDADKLIRAVHAYTLDLKARGIAVGETCSLDELIRSGFLNPEDASGFDGMEVEISSDMIDTMPQSILARVVMPDGHEFAVLGDGSVQSVKR